MDKIVKQFIKLKKEAEKCLACYDGGPDRSNRGHELNDCAVQLYARYHGLHKEMLQHVEHNSWIMGAIDTEHCRQCTAFAEDIALNVWSHRNALSDFNEWNAKYPIITHDEMIMLVRAMEKMRHYGILREKFRR